MDTDLPEYDRLLQKGEMKRRHVLGDAHVDRSMSSTNEFDLPLQMMVTKFGWGEIWSRDGLPDKTRSLLNIAILTAIRQPNELKGHTIGALNNGCTPDEIREVVIHTFLYAGAPAALSAMTVISDTLAQHGKI